ncbi:ATP-binding cassette domain-containing protein [Arthrobacter sp.]|uniref:ATP-binding cassette domain-containing protein n=1 Tax=Arthrobacter sp. TaxID=1667 RepID=UPI003A944AC4
MQDIDLAVEPGRFVSIVGPTGSGKSTILHMPPAWSSRPPAPHRALVPGARVNRRASYVPAGCPAAVEDGHRQCQPGPDHGRRLQGRGQ